MMMISVAGAGHDARTWRGRPLRRGRRLRREFQGSRPSLRVCTCHVKARRASRTAAMHTDKTAARIPVVLVHRCRCKQRHGASEVGDIAARCATSSALLGFEAKVGWTAS
eukprot:1097428-Rhodomonas_salina.2